MDENQTTEGAEDQQTNDINGSVMSHGPKVIQPSAAFTEEMAKEAQTEPASQPIVAASETGPADIPASVAEDSARPKQTPQAIQDYINTEVGVEQSATAATEPVPVTSGAAPVSVQDQSVANAQPLPVTSAPQPVSPAESVDNPPASNLHPITGQPLVPSDPPKKPSGRKKWLAIGAGALVIVLAALAYVFLIYLPNTPSGTYSRAMNYSNIGYSKLVNYFTAGTNKPYKSRSLTGSLDFSEGNTKVDVSLNGKSDGSNTTGDLRTDLGGQKLALDAIALTGAGQTYPDVYLQASGVKPYLDSFGLSQLDYLDGQWIDISHTFIESYANELASTGSSDSSQAKHTTKAHVAALMRQIGSVNQTYLFTTDASKQVMVRQQFLGKPTLDGRQMYEYKMGYDKVHLKAYLDALINTAGTSAAAQDLGIKSKDVQDAVTNSDKRVAKLDSNYTFTMYVDAKTKLIHQVRFPSKDHPTQNYLAIGQNYTGGDNFPFTIEYHDGVDSSGAGDVQLTSTYNKASDEISLVLHGAGKDGDQNLTFNASLAVTPSYDKVTAKAPATSVPIETILQKLGFPAPPAPAAQPDQPQATTT